VTRIAIVLIVKDEAQELLSWLAWHFSLGCKTVFAFNDSSSDGTFEVLQCAAKHFDVRIINLAKSDDFFVVRQQACYEYVLAEQADNYDWIGFLDADEYVHLDNHSKIGELLDERADADAVAFNWCNFGSSAHLAPPKLPSPLAYSHHSPNTAFENHHIKSFVRPKVTEKRFVDVHRFAVEENRYRHPDGTKVAWHNAGGVTAGAPTWTGGRILHFKLRSLSHFVKRVLRNEHNASMRLTDFLELDTGLIHEDLHFRNRTQFLKVYSTLVTEVQRACFRDMSNIGFRIKCELAAVEHVYETVDIAQTLSEGTRDVHFRMGWTSTRRNAHHVLEHYAVSRVKTTWGTYICADQDGRLVHAGDHIISGHGLTPIVLVSCTCGEQTAGTLVSAAGSVEIGIGKDTMLHSFLPVRLENKGADNAFAIYPWDKATCFCADAYYGENSIGIVSDDRIRASDWEIFSVEPYKYDMLASVPASRTLVVAEETLQNLAAHREMTPIAVSSLLSKCHDEVLLPCGPVAFSLMDEQGRKETFSALGPGIRDLVF